MGYRHRSYTVMLPGETWSEMKARERRMRDKVRRWSHIAEGKAVCGCGRGHAGYRVIHPVSAYARQYSTYYCQQPVLEYAPAPRVRAKLTYETIINEDNKKVRGYMLKVYGKAKLLGQYGDVIQSDETFEHLKIERLQLAGLRMRETGAIAVLPYSQTYDEAVYQAMINGFQGGAE